MIERLRMPGSSEDGCLIRPRHARVAKTGEGGRAAFLRAGRGGGRVHAA
jgi:hypothetical protein